MNVKEIEGLISFIAQSGLEEVNLETEQLKLSIKKTPPAVQQAVHDAPPTSTPLSQSSAPSSSQAIPADAQATYLKAPMIGTFYGAAKPGDPPFVQIGDTVKKGDTLCIIEAMKLFNEIEAEAAGTIVEVLVEDASPVEYDQPLFRIAPLPGA